jgi:predicted metal-dependent phosphoesterase TrpH
VIDLHLHTTASDGLLLPELLVERAAQAGLTIISITDHDSVAGIDEARAAGQRFGIRIVTGIEMTAVARGRDVHILGYFLDPESERLASLLQHQRSDRVRRVREMSARLASLGCPIDVETVLAGTANSHRSVGRPAVADALVSAGRVRDRNEAFEQLLGRGKPAFVPRVGVSPEQVVDVIHAAGGIASLAHPGVTADDTLIDDLIPAGLDAIEVWHADHTPDVVAHYSELAARCGLGRSGGSDYHGDGAHRACQLGAVTLPPDDFADLDERAGKR